MECGIGGLAILLISQNALLKPTVLKVSTAMSFQRHA
jgi:hypothetical protein